MILPLSSFLYTSDDSICWNIRWINDFESPWSIFEKVKFANMANKKDIFLLFGEPTVRVLKSIVGDKHHNLYYLSAFDNDLFKSKLGFSLKQYNYHLLNGLTGFLEKSNYNDNRISDNMINRYWRENFTFCLECMQDGYHSQLHQLVLLKQCPFHQTQLHDKCPRCNQSISYSLNDSHFESPYSCICGYSYKHFQRSHTLSSQWGRYTIQSLKDPELMRWLNLTEEEKKILANIHLYPQLSISNTPQLLHFLLKVIGWRTSSNKNELIITISSSGNIQRLKDANMKKVKKQLEIKKWSPITQSLNIINVDNAVRIILKEFLDTKHHILSAYDKKLRKTVLHKHRSCIQRYSKVMKITNQTETPICPYAYAYVKWKQSLLKIDHYYDLSTRFSGYSSQKRVDNLAFVRYDENDPLVGIIDACITSFPIENPEFLAHIKWLIAHMTMFVSKQLFESWLFNQRDNEPLVNRIYINNQVYAFRFPINQSQPFVVIHSKRRINQDLTTILNCPYSTVKLKRKTIYEKSFHPMTIATENYSETVLRRNEI